MIMGDGSDKLNQSGNGSGGRVSAEERRERFSERQAEKTRREIGRFHKRDFVYIALLSALILVAVLILLDMRNLRGGNDVKVVIPPTATAAENDTTSRAAAAPAAASPTEAAPDVRAIGGTQGTDILININTAGTEELKSLPGIGEKRAEDIIAYRNANGAFPDIYAIKDVPGIGDGIFEQLADKITV